jgi:hypothetical protein
MAAQPPTFWLKISFSQAPCGHLLPLIISEDADGIIRFRTPPTLIRKPSDFVRLLNFWGFRSTNKCSEVASMKDFHVFSHP